MNFLLNRICSIKKISGILSCFLCFLLFASVEASDISLPSVKFHEEGDFLIVLLKKNEDTVNLVIECSLVDEDDNSQFVFLVNLNNLFENQFRPSVVLKKSDLTKFKKLEFRYNDPNIEPSVVVVRSFDLSGVE